MTAGTESDLDELRSRAFAIAYRMLGSVSDAEDVAQESLIRYHGALERDETIDAPPAYVATVATRLAIDELRSARARRETYVGEWLPEPLPTEAEPVGSGRSGFPDPADRAELADSLSLAFLVLLEKLTPEQRAALLLHDVFDYSHEEVAEVIGTSVASSRQLASRARRVVSEGRPRAAGPAERQRELAGRFFDAMQAGDLGGLEAMLAEDVALKGDGGGKVPALARVIRGRRTVARTLRNWSKVSTWMDAARFDPVELNGHPGALIRLGNDSVIAAMTIETDGERITGLNSVVNPEKLGHLGEVVEDYSVLLKKKPRD